MTTANVVDLGKPQRTSGLVAAVIRDLVKTTVVYLLVGLTTGLVYVVGTLAWQGDTTVRLWLSAVVPIFFFVLVNAGMALYRHFRYPEVRQLDLFE